MKLQTQWRGSLTRRRYWAALEAEAAALEEEIAAGDGSTEPELAEGAAVLDSNVEVRGEREESGLEKWLEESAAAAAAAATGGGGAAATTTGEGGAASEESFASARSGQIDSEPEAERHAGRSVQPELELEQQASATPEPGPAPAAGAASPGVARLDALQQQLDALLAGIPVVATGSSSKKAAESADETDVSTATPEPEAGAAVEPEPE